MINNKKVAFVLSGGGCLGFAHVGVLRCLKELGIEPDIITGTSAGALIGGAYAIGMSLDDIENQILTLSKIQIIDLKFAPFLGDSVLASKKIDQYLQDAFKNEYIENAKIKFVATAVDVNHGKLKYFTKGLMWEAVRASISVPALFTAFKIGDIKYIDGGIMDNMPTTIAKEMGADIIIAVNCIDYDNALLEPKTGVHAMINAFTLAQKEMIKIKTRADYVINLSLKDVTMFGFKKKESEAAIKQGYEQTKAKAKFIQSLFKDL